MLTVLIGAPGSGKSTLASDAAAAGAVVLSLDAARAVVGAHEGDQTATAAAVDYTIRRAHQTLAEGRPVVIDATSTTAPERATWLGIARERGVPARAVVLDTPLPVCLARNLVRPPHRRVPDDVLERMWAAVHDLTDTTLRDEGFAHVSALATLDPVDD